MISVGEKKNQDRFLLKTENYYSIHKKPWIKVNHQQPRSARLRPIQKIPIPKKLLISPLLEMINQICKKYSLENSQDKKTSDDTCDIFQK